MPFLPDVLQVGTFPLDIRVVTGLLGLLLAYVAAGWGRPRAGGAGARPARDLVLDLAIGGIIGAKLIDVLLHPAGYIANPLALALFPYGPLALPAGLAGAALAAGWGLRARPDRLTVLDDAAAPLLFGLALASAGFRGSGAWAFPLLLWPAAIAAALAGRGSRAPGWRTAATVIIGGCGLALADIARPGAGLAGGVSGLQLAAALASTAAWLWLRRIHPVD